MTTIAPPKVLSADKKLQMSYEEFLDRFGEDDHAEWVNGEVVTTMTVSVLHQLIVDFLNRLLGFFVEAHDLGRLMSGPAQAKLPKFRARTRFILCDTRAFRAMARKIF